MERATAYKGAWQAAVTDDIEMYWAGMGYWERSIRAKII